MLSIYLYIHKALHVWYSNLVVYLMQSWFIKSMIQKGNYITRKLSIWIVRGFKQ